MKSIGVLPLIFLLLQACSNNYKPSITKEITIETSKKLQRIDGFGVNITPAQWRNGNLIQALDKLVDDLGANLFRFDCTGLANWLDPARRKTNGTYPEDYLDSVYSSAGFKNAWNCFHYLNKKGVRVFFNVSGRISPLLGRKDEAQHLADFDGYAEMCVTMLDWARNKESLKFTFFAPFNENNLGYPEGAKLLPSEYGIIAHLILKKLEQHSMADVRLIMPDDAGLSFDNLNAIISDSSLAQKISVFATHTYGNGDSGDDETWFTGQSDLSKYVQIIKEGRFSAASAWLTEYGDLDQTGEIEYEFSWRSDRRLMKALRDGYQGALAWDAFDNFHEHDTAWAKYGLLQTDTIKWTYTPRKRYFAAKQFYHFVKPGWHMVEISQPAPGKNDIYKIWHDPLKNLRLLAFISGDGADYSIIGMNLAELPVDLNINLKQMDQDAADKKAYYYRTNSTDDCMRAGSFIPENGILSIYIPERTIFTVSTIHSYYVLRNLYSQ